MKLYRVQLFFFLALIHAAFGQPAAQTANSDARFQIPATDAGLPGTGPIMRADWFQKLWTEHRSRWASRALQDQHSVVFLGDSITEGWGDDFGGSFPGLRAVNRGIGGDTTRGVLIRLQDDVLSLHPSAVVLLIGINDIGCHAEPASIAGNLKLILAEFKRTDPRMPVILCQVFPSSATRKGPASQIERLNQLYADAAKENPQVTFLATWPLFANQQGEARPEEFPDLVHPNQVGYAKWAAALRPALASLGLYPASTPPTYYVDASAGSDAYDGLSPSAPWQTLERVNAASVPAGSTILFKRGQIWRGQLIPRSGTNLHPTRYGAWGTGEKPMLLGSVNRGKTGDWINDGEDVWKCATPFETDVGNLIFNGATSFGHKKWARKDLTEQGSFYYDRSTKELAIHSRSNPALYYKDIEVALRRNIIDENNTSFVTYENLALRFGGAHGIGGSNDAFIAVRNCEISFIGGGDLLMNGSNIRYGNGVEFWANAHDCLVEHCRIWEIYDTALTNQNTFEDVKQFNISYRNNVTWNCAYGTFECWSTTASSEMINIRFENNTCYGAGEGWGKPPQRPDPAGYQLTFRNTPGKKSGICIRNNIFCRSNRGLWIEHFSQWDKALSLDFNCWYQASGTMVLFEDISRAFTMTQFVEYQLFGGKDAHSVAVDPLFINTGAKNFHLQANSPCVGSGLDIGLATDCDGKARPTGRGTDMGAYAK